MTAGALQAHDDVQTLAAYARQRALLYPDRVAFSASGRTISYQTLLSEAQALAGGLWQIGLRPGDVVSFQLPNWIETAIINLAANLLGLRCNPIVPIYRDSELLGILSAARTRCFFVPQVWGGFDYAAMARRLQSNLPELQLVATVRAEQRGPHDYETFVAAGRSAEPAYPELDPTDTKLLMFTSGTSGRAKGVLHSQASLVAPLMRACARWPLRENDCMLMPSPVTHITGYCCGLEMPLFLGTRTVLMESWNAAAAVQLIQAENVHATVGATPFLKELLDAAEAAGTNLPSLRVFACGGAAVPAQLIERADRLLSGRAFRVYGMTEAPLITFGIAADDPPQVAAHTDGRLNGYVVRVDDTQHAAQTSVDGEIWVRGSGLFRGYLDPADGADAFTPDGFFRTGDLGRRAGDALLITGRKKDLIIRGGENISAKEIEDVLLADPAIRAAAAVSMPHERLGETVCLYAVLAPGCTLELQQVCAILERVGLARQKFPERLVIVDELPKTPSGKIRKDLLRARLWGPGAGR
jgi:acyl-CoA synthetase (AMP-forming)/AMP-acid ligase II